LASHPRRRRGRSLHGLPAAHLRGLAYRRDHGQAAHEPRPLRRLGRTRPRARRRGARMSKIIIACAVTGSVHTPTMTPRLPITPAEIAASGIEAAAAGAAILHLHARDPDNGRPSAEPELFMDFLGRIRAGCDAVANVTTGGSAVMSLDERLAGPRAAAPEMCSLNLGSMNFGLFGAAERYVDWQFDWEKPFLEGTRDLIFRNTFADIESIFDELGNARGARFEYECYDVGHLYTLAHFADRGLVGPPYFIQFVFGILGGIGADVDNLVHMRRIADKLFG